MRAVPIIVATVAVLLLTLGAVAADAPGFRQADVYQVTYEPDGGVLPATAPESYVSGSYMSLPVPSKEGVVFGGWFLDEELTVPIGGVPKDSVGDLTVYARWVEDPTGTAWTMEVEGSYANGDIPHTISGTVEYGYGGMSDGRLLLYIDSEVTYSWPDGSVTNASSSATWTYGVWYGWTYVGNDTVDGMTVTVWTSDGSTMWVLDMLYPLRVESPVGNGEAVRTLTEASTWDPPSSFVPTIVAEHPVTVGSPGRVNIGEPVTLTAEGDGFAGWYVDGRLVSAERTVTLSGLTPTSVITAASSVAYVVVNSGTDMYALGYSGGTFQDSAGEEVDPGSIGTGYYTCYVTSDGVTRTAGFVVEGTRTFSVEWEWDGVTYAYSAELSYSDVFSYSYANPNMPRFAVHQQSFVERFYTYRDPALAGIAEYLMTAGSDMDRLAFAGFVLSMVQSIPYITDLESTGVEEYWKFPAETLWDGGGDCEDLTFLYGTLMGMCGYRTAFVLFMDHAMAAVSVDADGYSVTVEGYRFILCETTTEGFDVGDTSVGHLPGDAIFSCRIETVPAARWRRPSASQHLELAGDLVDLGAGRRAYADAGVRAGLQLGAAGVGDHAAVQAAGPGLAHVADHLVAVLHLEDDLLLSRAHPGVEPAAVLLLGPQGALDGGVTHLGGHLALAHVEVGPDEHHELVLLGLEEDPE